jgi:phospholipase C
MRLSALYLWSGAIGASLALAGCGGGSAALPQGGAFGPFGGLHSSPIQHVVVIIQENRSFDNLFATFPGARGATRGKMAVKKGSKYVDEWVNLKAEPLIIGNDIPHCHSAFETDRDGGKMDGFGLVPHGVCGSHGALEGTQPYQYVEESQIEPYWDIAEQWVLADEMFQTQGSGSFTAHQDLIRGGTCITTETTCYVASPPPTTASLIDDPTNFPWGCDGTQGEKTSLIYPSGHEDQDGGPFPCSDKFPDYGSDGYPTLRDLLDAKSVSWKFYTPCFSAKVQTGCSPTSDCIPHAECAGGTLNAFDVIWPVRNGSEWGTNVSWPETNILSDITNKQLPAVSWVIPEDNDDDHPGEKVDKGPSWVATVVNAVGQSSYWKSSVIIVLWDDWGGFYDNAKPPFKDGLGGLGFRVPMLLLSPYARMGTSSKGGYISHTQYEFASILKYIENNWNLGLLHTTDKRAKSIGDVLNYSQPARSFTMIPSDEPPEFFLREPHPPQHGDPE